MSSLFGFLPPVYAFVGLPAVGVTWLTFAQTALVFNARMQAKVPYPQLYAEKQEAADDPVKYRYNCVQRVHQNTIEVLPSFYTSLCIAGIKFPRFACGAGLAFLISRVVYTIGYASGQPSKRVKGAVPSTMSLISLQVAATLSALKLVLEALE
ncbi:unnamed protein product [Parajaminaea phylloscopi]